MQNILVGIDFSELTPRVVEKAATLGMAFGSTVRLLHVAPPDPAFASSKAWPREVRDEMARELHTEHQELQGLAQLLERRGLESKALLTRGPIAATILKVAEETGSDLIILGSQRQGALAQLLPRSVIKDIIHKAPCAVLVVPGVKSKEA